MHIKIIAFRNGRDRFGRAIAVRRREIERNARRHLAERIPLDLTINAETYRAIVAYRRRNLREAIAQIKDILA